MTRSIPAHLAPMIELLELERPTVVTPRVVKGYMERAGVRGSTGDVIHRLALRGWLLPTGVQGSWEFVPAERAGRYSSNDPWLPLMAYLARHPTFPAMAALGSALYLHQHTDRGPDRPEIAVPPGSRIPPGLTSYHVTRYRPVAAPIPMPSIPVEAPVSLLVHLAEEPNAVRSWAPVLSALPALAKEVTPEDFRAEVQPRTAATRARLGYLLERVAPNLVQGLEPAGGTVWFGPRGVPRRTDPRWRVADTLLPYRPGHLPE